MSNLSGIVDSLESRVVKLLQEYKNLKRLNTKLEDEITILKSQQDQNIIEIDSWKDECNTLRIANSMLGSNIHKRETKLKINELVREIDKCITQLSE
jgi:archaellum component FlaC